MLHLNTMVKKQLNGQVTNKFYIVLFAILFTMMVSYGIYSVVPQTEYDCDCYEIDCYEKEAYQTCEQNYYEAQESESKMFFIIALVVSTIAFTASFFVPIQNHLALSSIFTIVVASSSYWQYAGNVIKFMLSAISLAILTYYLNK